MATKILTPKGEKAFPRSSLKTGMSFNCTQIKNGQLVIKGEDAHIVHNVSKYDGGKPRPMPKGFRYGWSLGSSSKVDLTYRGKFTNISVGAPAKEAVVTEGKGGFKNSFRVKGTKSLLRAFAEEAKLAGWKQQGGEDASILFFNAGPDSGLKSQSFWWAANAGGKKTYTLPKDWETAIKAAKEKGVTTPAIPAYVKCIIGAAGQFTVGRFYKTNKGPDDGTYYIAKDDIGSITNGLAKSCFVAATEVAFKAQGPLWKPAIRIGCNESRQLYTKQSLITLLCVMKQYGAGKTKHCHEEVTFSPNMVRKFIKMLDCYEPYT